MIQKINLKIIFLIISYLLGVIYPTFSFKVQILTGLILLLNISFWYYFKKIDYKLLLIFILLFAFGIVRYFNLLVEIKNDINNFLVEENFLKAKGIVENLIKHTKNDALFTTLKVSVLEYFDSKTKNYKTINGQLYVNFNCNELNNTISDGDIIEFEGVVKKIHYFKNPYIYNKSSFNNNTNFSIKTTIYSIKKIKTGSYILKIKYKLKNLFFKFFPNEIAGFLIAFVLGDSTYLTNSIYLDYDLKFSFFESGLLHILVVSGGHIVLITYITILILNSFKLPVYLSNIILLLLVSVYYLLVGLQHAVTRAYLAFVVTIFYKSLNSNYYHINIFILVFFIHCIIFPQAIFSIGYWLSYITTFALICSNFFIDKNSGKISNFKFNLFLSLLKIHLYPILFALLSSYPLISYVNGYFTLNIFLSNFLTLWFYEIILYLSYFFIFLTLIYEQFGWYLSSIIYYFVFLTLKINELIASIPTINIAIYNLSFIEMICLYIFLIVVMFILYNKKISVYKLLTYLLLILFILSLRSLIVLKLEPSELTFLDVGQGDCIVIKTKNREWIFIDLGGSNKSYENVILPFIRKKRISEIRHLIITHPHLDHYCNAINLLKDAKVRVKNLYYPIYSLNQKTEIEFKKLLNLCNMQKMLRVNDEIIEGDVKIKVLWPDESIIKKDINLIDDINNISLVLVVTIKNKNFLITGDITKSVENLIKSKVLNYNFLALKSPHHGSITSNSEEFLKVVNADIVYISTKASNNFLHPHPNVIKRYNDLKYKVFVSSKSGGITFLIDKKVRIIDFQNKLITL